VNMTGWCTDTVVTQFSFTTALGLRQISFISGHCTQLIECVSEHA
jgi:hypothetical protein